MSDQSPPPPARTVAAQDESVPPEASAVAEVPVEEDEQAIEREPEQCPNCGTPRRGDYCYRCGQHFMEGRLTLRRFGKEFVARFFRLERGLLHTFLQLCTEPGAVARRYVEGQRKRYANPLAYILLAATVSLLLFGFSEDVMLEYYVVQNEQMLEGASEEMMEAWQATFGEDPARGMAEGTVTVVKQLNTYLTLLIALVFALLLRLFFGGTRYNYAEMLVFAFFTTGQLTLLMAIVTPFVLPISFWLYLGVFIVGYTVYYAIAARGFFGRTASASVLAVLAFYGGYLLFIASVLVVGFVGGFVYAILT
ncbi:MAG: DUF3667 domain-containing protein [Bacteroidetes bacterium]|nr:DUF3667 domain-containing protein [Bacteroidota bacterium]